MAEMISGVEKVQLLLAATYAPQSRVDPAERDELEAQLAALVDGLHDALGRFLNVVKALGGTQ